MYIIGGIGAGDVKLLCVVGAMMGKTHIITIIFMTLIFGAVLCLTNLIYSVLTGKGQATTAYVFGRRYKGLHKMHFSYAIMAATLFDIFINGGLV